MSVIQRIRDKAAWIIFGAIALALIAFIVQDASFRRGNVFSNSSTIGKVNGQSIDKKELDEKIALVEQMQQAQGVQRDQLISSVWNFMVDETVLKQQYQKLGLAFSAKELNDILFGNNPPAWLRQQFTDPATGVFNVDQAKQYFAQIKKQKDNPNVSLFYNAYIQPTIDQTLRQKYNELISGAVYVPKWMAEKTSTDNNGIANISYVYVPYASVSDSAVKVSDDEIAAYVSKHPNDFKQDEETRQVSYVTFDATPSAQDSVAVFNQLSTLKSEMATNSDMKTFIGVKGSEAPFFDGYVTSVNMKMPNADTLKRLGDGQVYGPYLDGQNYVVAKMVGRREMPDSVKVRHILVKTADRGQPVLADSVAKARIDSIANAIKAGASFEAMVAKYSDDDGSKGTKGEYEFPSSQFGGLTKEFAETAFYGNAGDKKVVKVESGGYSGYHYIEVLQQKNRQTAYKVAYLSKPIAASQETISAASSASQQFAAASRSKKQFEETATKQNKAPIFSPELRENDFSIPGLGENRTFIKWIFEHNTGDISEPTEIGEHYVVALINSVNKAGLLSAAAARPMVEPILKNEKKAQQIIAAKFKGNTLEAYAQSAGTTVQRADSISFQSPVINGVGNEPKVIGVAFNKNIQGKVSEPIAGNTGVFAVKGEGISARASMSASPDDQRKAIENNMRAQIRYRSMDAIRRAAEVKDFRSKFF